MASGRLKSRKPPSQPHVAAREPIARSTNDQPPCFTFCYLAPDFRVSDCEHSDKGAFADRLQELGQLTWGQITQAPRQGMGTETIPQDRIIPAIPRHITPDIRLLSWRFGRGARIIGYRDEQVFHVVWIDPNHRAYPG